MCGTLRGLVFKPYQPVGAVKVSARLTGSDERFSTLTSTAGLYALHGLPIGRYELSFHCEGYHTARHLVEVLLDTSRTFNVLLAQRMSNIPADEAKVTDDRHEDTSRQMITE